MSQSSSLTYKIASNGIVAAIYFVLTVASTPIAYGDIQVRIAEFLMLLCFFRRDFILGVTLGCLLANFNSTLGLWDVLIGTSATLLSAILIAYCTPYLWLAALYPILVNAFVVAAELNWLLELDYWYCVLTVGLGETIAMAVGYIIFMALKKRKGFLGVIKTNRHLDYGF
ncbi:MAG: QueT transporter family protein [Bacillota bacterium]|nr:QueT transporter family protein [Bacillota bacterium]